MTIKLICLDADDTLWHNMRHFNATEEALVAMLQPFADADIARDTLNACEGRNLKLYGYGAKGFTLSMIETAAELAGDQISKSMIEDILAAGRAAGPSGRPVRRCRRHARRAGPPGSARAGDEGRPVAPGIETRSFRPGRPVQRH